MIILGCDTYVTIGIEQLGMYLLHILVVLCSEHRQSEVFLIMETPLDLYVTRYVPDVPTRDVQMP